MKGAVRAMLAALVALAACAGCRPTLDDRPWLIRQPHIVGMKAEPPEVAPGGSASLQIVALDPAGPVDATAAAWTFCRTRKPLGENRAVAAECLAPAAADAVGDPVMVAIPADACQLFGPDTPQPRPGAPPTRPRDPDATGGYFQPVTIALAGALAVGLQRVTCGLPDASLADARAFQAAYQRNLNPAIASLAFSLDDGAAADPGAIPAGARVTVQVAWSAGSAEAFPIYDRAARAVVERRESLVASWYVTGGDLDRAAAEVADPAVLTAAATWTAPPEPDTLEIVVVVRDSRGGADFARAAVAVVR